MRSHDDVIRIEIPGFGAGGADVRGRYDVLQQAEGGREGGGGGDDSDATVTWIANHYCYEPKFETRYSNDSTMIKQVLKHLFVL